MVTVKTLDEFNALSGTDLEVFFEMDTVNLNGLDFSKVKNLKFKDGAKVLFHKIDNLPKDTDVSMCSQVGFVECNLSNLTDLSFNDGAGVVVRECSNLPKNIDVSKCNIVKFLKCDMAGVNKFQFKDASYVVFESATNLDDCLDYDFTKCKKVELFGCDLENANLRFRDGAKVNLMNSNLPADLDVSKCDSVDLSKCNLANVKKLQFKRGSHIVLAEAYNFNHCMDFDFRLSPYVDLSGCILDGVNPLFGNGSAVVLRGATLPKSMDVSKCVSVDFSGCNVQYDYKFADDADIIFAGCVGLPSTLNVSRCSMVDFSKCDVSNCYFSGGFKEGANIILSEANLPNTMIFPKDCTVNFSKVKKFPQKLVLTNCKIAEFKDCDLSGVSLLALGSDTSHNLKDATAMPKVLEFLNSDNVDLSGCDLSNVTSIKFKEGAVVDLTGAKLPKVWDVSDYKDVQFRGANASGVTKVTFRDRKQSREFKNMVSGYSATSTFKGQSTKNLNNGGTFAKFLITAVVAGGIVATCYHSGNDDNENNNNGNGNENTSVDAGSKVSIAEKIKNFKEWCKKRGDKVTHPDKNKYDKEEQINLTEQMIIDWANAQQENQTNGTEGSTYNREEQINLTEQIITDWANKR